MGEYSSITTDLLSANMSRETQTTPSRKHKRPLVYVTRRIPQEGVDVLLKTCDIRQWDSEQAVPRGEFLYSVGGVEGILCVQGDRIDVDVLDIAGPRLCVVATLSQRTEHIDMVECHRRDIQVITCPYQTIDALAELTVSLVLLTIKESQTEEEMLNSCVIQPPDLISNDPSGIGSMSMENTKSSLLKRLPEEQLAFQWTHGKPANSKCLTWRKLTKKTFGVYGLTKLGISVARILKTISVFDVLITDEDAECDKYSDDKSNIGCRIVYLDELLDKSDVICVCGSAAKKSKDIFCRETFDKMKNDTILIASQSREKVIDYMELYSALRDGQIKAAGLNDCNQEPVPFKTLLLGMRYCTFLPQTQEGVCDIRHEMSVLIARDLTEALNKKTNL